MKRNIQNKDWLSKTVWISGASSGIGRATALLYAQLGVELILVGRNTKELLKTAKECQKYTSKIIIWNIDLTDFEEAEKKFKFIKKIDVAVNNAGYEGKWLSIDQLDLKDFDQVININFKSMWFCNKKQIEIMNRASSGGVIINISSIAGTKAFSDESLYVSSKWAVVGMTKALALEQIKNKIRINCISPGGTDTPMLGRVSNKSKAAKAHPVGRLATPEEIAQSIYWLSSKESSFVVGHNLVIDGGLTLV